MRLLNEAIAAATQIERYARGRLLRKRLPELRADLERRREEARAAAAAAKEKAREEFAAAMRRAAGAPNFDLRPGRRASLAAIASGVTPTGGRDSPPLVAVYERLGAVKIRRRGAPRDLPPLMAPPPPKEMKKFSKAEVDALIEKYNKSTKVAHKHTTHVFAAQGFGRLAAMQRAATAAAAAAIAPPKPPTPEPPPPEPVDPIAAGAARHAARLLKEKNAHKAPAAARMQKRERRRQAAAELEPPPAAEPEPPPLEAVDPTAAGADARASRGSEGGGGAAAAARTAAGGGVEAAERRTRVD